MEVGGGAKELSCKRNVTQIKNNNSLGQNTKYHKTVITYKLQPIFIDIFNITVTIF